MPINPDIPLAVRPVSPIGLDETPMESQAKAVALQGNVLEQQQKIRALRTQQAFGQAIAENGGDVEKALPQLYRLDPMTAMGIHRQLTADKQKAALAELEGAKSRRESQKTQLEQLQMVSGHVNNILALPPDQRPAAWEDMRQGMRQFGGMELPAYSEQTVNWLGKGLDSEFKKMNKDELAYVAAGTGPAADRANRALELLRKGETTHIAPELGAQVVGPDEKPVKGTVTFDRGSGEYRLNGQPLPEGARVERAPAPEKPVDQNKLEQQYRQVLTRELLNGSSPVGIEHKKVNTAIHLSNLFDSAYDPKTGKYNIPAAMEEELVMNIATLLSPNARVGPQVMALLAQPTLYSKMAGLATFFTGTPQTGNTQDVLKMFKDVVDRQGAMSEQIRDQELGAVRALAPTELEESRRTALESSQLPSFINRKKTGAGGKTVKMVAPDGGELNVPEADVDAAIKAGAKRK